MAGLLEPNLGLYYGWALGEGGWNTGIDSNFKRLGALVNTSVINMTVTTATLPGSPTNGDRYIIASGVNANSLVVRIAGAWQYYVPTLGTRVWNIAEPTKLYVWTGTAWVNLVVGGGGSGSGDALVANPLSQFAPTTSAQLAGVLTDDVGTSGGFMRAGSPTIITPTIAKIANLTSNGFIKTSGGDGTLSVDINALNTLLPTQTGNSGKVLGTNGATSSWVTGGSGGGTGTVSDTSYASLSAAVTAISATPLTLVISTALYPNGANVTVPATLTLQFVGAGTLTLTTGQTVTILSDNSDWPIRKLFVNATAGQGTISFSGNKLASDVWSEWWGAVKDASTNDAVAIQAAINAAVTGSLTLRLGSGRYHTGSTTLDTPTTSNGQLTVRGLGMGISRIIRTTAVAAGTFEIKLTGASARVEMSDFTIDGPTGIAPHGAFSNLNIGIGWITADIGHYFRLERIEVTGTHDTSVENSKGGTFEVIDCYLWGTDTNVAMFESTNTANSAYFYARGGTWQCPDGDLSTAGSVGLYIHPHIAYKIEGVTFKSLGRYGVYQNGSPSAVRKYATCTGCSFIDAEMAQTKTTGLSVFDGCAVNGSSSGLGSSLGGEVVISGSSFERTKLLDGATAYSNIAIAGSRFTDSKLILGGSNTNAQLRSSIVMITDDFTLGGHLIQISSVGFTDLTDVTFHDRTTTAVYQSCVYVAGTAVRMNKLSTVGTLRGTLGFIYSDYSATNILDNSDIAGNVALATGTVVNTWEGSNNKFRSGGFTGASSLQQRFVRRAGVNPTAVASATSISTSTAAWLSYDTHVVTGSSAITNLTNPYPCVGVVRLIVDAAGTWSTANSGNITPLTTAARAAGQVVTLLWEPTAAKWLEIAPTSVNSVSLGIPIGDESTAITTGVAKSTFRMPHAMTLTTVRASLTTASSSGIPTFDINEGGVSLLSTKLTIDANEKTSTTAATAAVISDTALADDAEITIDVDVAGTGAAGAKIWLIGTR